jgi:hypothetical protein
MTLSQAFSQLIESKEFKEVAKKKDSKGGKYRAYLTKFKRGELGPGAMVPILIDHGYEIKANRAKKGNTK